MFDLYLYLATLLVLLISILQYIWNRRQWYLAAKKLKGPPAYPIIGNALEFWCKDEDIQKTILKVIKPYEPGPVRFWLGPKLAVIFVHPSHVEKILSTSKFSRKQPEIYRFPQLVLGNGLITGSGPLLKMQRRIIQPMLGLSYVAETIAMFPKHIDLCMKKLESYVDGDTFDISHTIHACMADFIKEVILGSTESSQVNGVTKFDHAMLEVYQVVFSRMIRAWQQVDLIFNLTALKTKQDDAINTIRSFGRKIVDQSFARVQSKKQPEEFVPLIDRMAQYSIDHPDFVDVETFIDHILTLYTASEDTLTIVSSFLPVCWGMYPETQRKAAEEVRKVFGDTPRAVTIDDIPKLSYISMCVKEVLRFYPIAPLVARDCPEDFEVDGLQIPKGCALVVAPLYLHRDPRYWEKPDEFYPENFLPEAVERRPVYSYIPFSAGPRGCLGKIMANNGLKAFAASFLQRFEVEADGNVDTFKVKMDISTRAANGYRVRLKKRVWK